MKTPVVRNLYSLSLIWQLGISLMIPVVCGIGGGIWLDQKFMTTPIFTLLGITLGLIVAGVGFYQELSLFLKHAHADPLASKQRKMTQKRQHAALDIQFREILVLVYDQSEKLALKKMTSGQIYQWEPIVSGTVSHQDKTYEAAAVRITRDLIGFRPYLDLVAEDIIYFQKANKKEAKLLIIYKTIFEGPFIIDKQHVEKVVFLDDYDLTTILRKKETMPKILTETLLRHVVNQ